MRDEAPAGRGLLDEALVADVLAAARAGGAGFAEVYVERCRRRHLRTLDGEVKEATSGLERGAGLRLFRGLEVAYAYTNDLTPGGLREVVEQATRLRGGRVDAEGRGGLDFRKAAARGLHAPEVEFDTRPKSYRLDRLREADAGARVAPEVRHVECILQEWDQQVLVANSEGAWAEDRRPRTRLYVTAIAEERGAVQRGTEAPGLSIGLEFFDRCPPRLVGRAAGEQAMLALRAGPAPAGTMPVVMGNGFGGVIFHEAVGHLLETTAVAKKASVLADRLGEMVASPVVTYIDDGTTPHGWGSSEYDDEGTPTERTVLIERGVLTAYMADRRGAMLTGYRLTGSARRQDYTWAPGSRMRNTFIAPGEAPRDDLFDGIALGLYAKRMRGGQVKPGSGEFNFGVREAYVIRHGRIAEPVRGAMLVGRGPETIRKIVAVSTDLEAEPGICMSISGSVPVEVGQPHLLVSDLVVGGEA